MDIVPLPAGPLIEAPEGHLLIGPPQLHQVPERDQRDRADSRRPLLPQLHHGDRLVLSGLGKGVLEGGAAVAHRLPPHRLGAVEVAQGHIVEGVENGHVHVVRPAHGDLLRVAPGGAGDELVGDQHVPEGGVHPHGSDGRGQGIGVGVRRPVGKAPADVGWLHEGQEINAHRAVFVRQGDGDHPAVIDGGDVDAPLCHEPSAEGQALRGIVVAADEEDLEVPPSQPDQKVVQQGHRLGGGHRLVVDVPGDEHGVRRLPIHDPEDLVENIPLVLQHGVLIDPLAQVQVGEMEQFHGDFPPKCGMVIPL